MLKVKMVIAWTTLDYDCFRSSYCIASLFSATSFIEGASDPSDKTLIRVLRSHFDEEENGMIAAKTRKPRKGNRRI